MKKLTLIIVLFFLNYSFAIAPPTGSTNQYFCNSNPWTLEDLTVNSSTGQVFWFGENDNSGTQLPISTVLTNGATYFAFESTNISDTSLAITVHLLAEIPAPESTFFGSPCISEEGNITLADLNVFNTNEFSTIYWFVENNSSGNPLPSNTIVYDNYSYYAFQGLGDCALGIEVVVNFGDILPAPFGEQEQGFCADELNTLADLLVSNTAGYTTILFYADEFQNEPLPTTTVLENGFTYFAFQGYCGTDCACIVDLPITISLFSSNTLPNVDSDRYFCDDVTTTLNDIYPNAFWFLTPNISDLPLDNDITVTDNTTYYGFLDLGGCAEATAVTVHLIDCSTVNINDEELGSFSMYPNPVKNIINLNFDYFQSDFKVIINDIRGRSVFVKRLNTNINTLKIDVSKLETNLYFLSLITKQGIITQKFVKK